MKAKSIRVYNLIPFLSGRADAIKRHEARPEKVLEAVRASCEQKERSPAAWQEAIERHCPIPFSHPYRAVADRLPKGDPLRTLGCWAYGAGNSWITIEEIAWEDGKKTVKWRIGCFRPWSPAHKRPSKPRPRVPSRLK